MRPRILRIITRLNIGGPARQVIYLNAAMQERGFDSELVSGREESYEGRVDPGGDRHIHLTSMRREIAPVSDVKALSQLFKLMRKRRPAVIHTHIAKAGTLGRIAARMAHVPVVVHTYHGHSLRGYFSPVKTRLLLGIERWLAKRTDALIAVSPAVRDELIEMGIGEPLQWHVMSVGIELEQFLSDEIPRAAGREQLSLAGDGPVVGIVSRLAPIKDHDAFLDAAARVAAARPDVTFVIAGDGEARASVEAAAREALGDRAKVLGWVHDLPHLYAALDVVVLTSRNEGTPVSLIEAGAAAVPVVGTHVGGVPDVVIDGVTGLLAAPGDPQAVADHIIALLDDPERARRMGAAGREWVKERFSAERLADDLADLYWMLLRRRGILP